MAAGAALAEAAALAAAAALGMAVGLAVGTTPSAEADGDGEANPAWAHAATIGASAAATPSALIRSRSWRRVSRFSAMTWTSRRSRSIDEPSCSCVMSISSTAAGRSPRTNASSGGQDSATGLPTGSLAPILGARIVIADPPSVRTWYWTDAPR